MTEHEKRIREFLSERATMRGLCPEQIAGANDSRLNTTDLRALLADLDAVRGALTEVCSLDPHKSSATEWNAALRKCDAALSAAKDGGWVAVPVEPTEAMVDAALSVALPGALRAAWSRMLAAAQAKGGE